MPRLEGAVDRHGYTTLDYLQVQYRICKQSRAEWRAQGKEPFGAEFGNYWMDKYQEWLNETKA